MKTITSIFLAAALLSACGDESGASGNGEATDGETKCMAPDYTVEAGEACDEVLKDCGNALCASGYSCVDAVCVTNAIAESSEND